MASRLLYDNRMQSCGYPAISYEEKIMDQTTVQKYGLKKKNHSFTRKSGDTEIANPVRTHPAVDFTFIS